jgi:tRNA (guanosine-2'-O-)-methyltransferase
MERELTNYLSSFLSESRIEVLNKCLSLRTRYITVVLEDIYQSQNASAVLRTCDCFGIQDVHIIENQNTFNEYINVTRGSSKWIDQHHYNQKENNTLDAIQQLKSNGYKIVATSPHENDIVLEEYDLTIGKSAFVFGNEKRGISDIVKKNADYFLKIPMNGFTESLNISVSVAIILHHLTNKLKTLPIEWKLTDDEKKYIMLDWLKKCVKSSDLIIKKYLESKEVNF